MYLLQRVSYWPESGVTDISLCEGHKPFLFEKHVHCCKNRNIFFQIVSHWLDLWLNAPTDFDVFKAWFLKDLSQVCHLLLQKNIWKISSVHNWLHVFTLLYLYFVFNLYLILYPFLYPVVCTLCMYVHCFVWHQDQGNTVLSINVLYCLLYWWMTIITRVSLKIK